MHTINDITQVGYFSLFTSECVCCANIVQFCSSPSREQTFFFFFFCHPQLTIHIFYAKLQQAKKKRPTECLCHATPAPTCRRVHSIIRFVSHCSVLATKNKTTKKLVSRYNILNNISPILYRLFPRSRLQCLCSRFSFCSYREALDRICRRSVMLSLCIAYMA